MRATAQCIFVRISLSLKNRQTSAIMASLLIPPVNNSNHFKCIYPSSVISLCTLWDSCNFCLYTWTLRLREVSHFPKAHRTEEARWAPTLSSLYVESKRTQRFVCLFHIGATWPESRVGKPFPQDSLIDSLFHWRLTNFPYRKEGGAAASKVSFGQVERVLRIFFKKCLFKWGIKLNHLTLSQEHYPFMLYFNFFLRK